MSKRKFDNSPGEITRTERMMKSTEWAMEDKIDPWLFVWWKEKMTRGEYEKIKNKVYIHRGA